MNNIKHPVICWFSGGVTSAVACMIAIETYGIDNCRIVFIDTKNEDSDTYRFMSDCGNLYGKQIESISMVGDKYGSIQDVWRKYKGLNFANGAICSSELKRAARIKFQRENDCGYQVFGYDIDEPKRAKSMALNYPNSKPIFPLLLFGYSKKDCIRIIQNKGIPVPRSYKWGFGNNNCLETGCVQGGIGYWQKIYREFPDRYNAMAEIEHELTDLKGKPVTMLKHQSKLAKVTGNTLLFLKPHPDYPEVLTVLDVKGREPKPLLECNGFCGTNDLSNRVGTEQEINYSI